MNAIPSRPMTSNSCAPCKWSSLNKTDKTVIELNNAPEINAIFFIFLFEN